MSKSFFYIVLCIAATFLAGCSKNLPANFDIDRTNVEVKEFTDSLFAAMSDGTTVAAYEKLLDKQAREKISLDKFQSMSAIIASKLGALKDLEVTGRSDYDSYAGGLLARMAYIGHFEKGNGDVTIAALKIENQWHILSFNVNSPLLSSPESYRERVEIYVENSDHLMPGAHATIIAPKADNKIVVGDAVVLSARWKVSMSNSHDGFVTLALSEAEASAVRKSEVLSAKALK